MLKIKKKLRPNFSGLTEMFSKGVNFLPDQLHRLDDQQCVMWKLARVRSTDRCKWLGRAKSGPSLSIRPTKLFWRRLRWWILDSRPSRGGMKPPRLLNEKSRYWKLVELKRLLGRVPLIWLWASERMDSEELGPPKREEGMEPWKLL